MKKILALLFLCCGIQAQVFIPAVVTGNITAAGATCAVTNACISSHYSSAVGSTNITITGAFVATLVVEFSADNGLNWFQLATITTPGPYHIPTGGQTDVRVRASAYTSGTAIISLTSGLFSIGYYVGDPCLSPAVPKSSVVLNVTTSAQVLAVSGTTSIYVCGFNATLAGTTPTFQFEYGTGAVCATGLTVLSGVYAPSGSAFVAYSPSYTAFKVPSANALCVATGGTTPSLQGTLTYIQQ